MKQTFQKLLTATVPGVRRYATGSSGLDTSSEAVQRAYVDYINKEPNSIQTVEGIVDGYLADKGLVRQPPLTKFSYTNVMEAKNSILNKNPVSVEPLQPSKECSKGGGCSIGS